jgi:hypothetical protein
MSPIQHFKLVTKADAAQVFGVCTKTVDHFIRDGLLPTPTRFASREYWHPEVFRNFLDRTFGHSEENKTSSESSCSDALVDAPATSSVSPDEKGTDRATAPRQKRGKGTRVAQLHAPA